LILFGGIQEVTRERDDVIAFNISKGKWITIEDESTFSQHKSPSNSPLKKQPTLLTTEAN